jgi:phage/plasmid-like protein (TIGR03299 family)
MVQIISQNDQYKASCHNLAQNQNTGKVSLAMANKGAWHGLGTVVSDVMTSTEALELGGLANWKLDKLPQFIITAQGQYVDTGCYSIVRGDTGQVLTKGTSVGERYTIVPNEELFDFLDNVLESIGARYETVGALGDGEKVWLLARYGAGDFTIGRSGQSVDRTESYMLLSSTHDGSGAIQVFPTNTRVVCQNTLRAAHRNAAGNEQRYSMRHTQNVSRNIAEATRVLGLASQTFAEFAVQAEAMSKKMVAPMPLFDSFIDETTSGLCIADVVVSAASLRDGSILRAIDMTENRDLRVSYEKQFSTARDKREKLYNELMTRYESETCQTGAPGSLWAGFNAITEAIDHGTILRYQGDTRRRAESRFESLVYGKGDAWKQLALQSALAMLAV